MTTTHTEARWRRRWIEHWEPDDEAFWEGGGKRIARRNLALSIFAEHFGPSVWVLWTAGLDAARERGRTGGRRCLAHPPC